MDLIGNFSIISFNKDFIVYELTFNGTPKNFINIMKEKNFNFDTQNKVWIFKMTDLNQLIIKFDYEKNFKDDDFYVSKSNKTVLKP
jgi:hypothetical protein